VIEDDVYSRAALGRRFLHQACSPWIGRMLSLT